MVPRAVLMKTGLKTVKNAKPLSTARVCYLLQTLSVLLEQLPLNVKGFVDSGAQGHMLETLLTSRFKDLMEDLLLLVEEQNGGRIMATSEESMLWHRRLGHVNFKNINKLVKDNLVRDLPLKQFKNDPQLVLHVLNAKQHRGTL
ncbi:putative ribonuclease H-like domain-containing protein [Tanacetum coccineum]